MRNFDLIAIEARNNSRWGRWRYAPTDGAAQEIVTVSEDGEHVRIRTGQELCFPIWGMWDDEQQS